MGAERRSFQCRRATEDEVPAVLAFLRETFGADAHQNRPGWFEWQYQRHPEGFHVQICLERERIVAVSGFLPCRVSLNGRTVRAAFSTSTMVHPEFRRRGLGGLLHRARLEAYDVALSSGQSEANRRLYAKMGWSVLGEYVEAVARKAPPRARSLRAFGKQALAWLAWVSRGRAARRRFGLVPDPERARAWARRWGARRFPGGAAGPVHDAAYLTWRYAEHPYFRYETCVVLDGPDEIGAAVLRRDAAGSVLVDAYAPPERLPAVLAGAAAASPGPVIRAVAAGRFLARAFRRAGWAVFRGGSLLIGATGRADLHAPLHTADWNFFAGDSDKDR